MRAKLGNIAKIYTGTGFPLQYQGNTSGKYPFYKVGDISRNAQNGNIYLEDCNNYVDDDTVKAIRGTIVPENSIVFAKIGEAVKLNRRAITGCQCLVDNNAIAVCPDCNQVSLMYFFYHLCAVKMEKLAEATTVPSVKKGRIEQLEINLPSIEEQKKIEKKLSKVFSLIALCKQQLTTLDELVKARFVEMFGDPICNPKNFPVFTVEEIAAKEKNALKAGPFGSALKKESYVSSGYKIYGQEQVISGNPNYGNYYISEEKYKSLENCKVQAGDVLISLVGTYGKLLILPEEFQPGIINPRLMKITFDKKKMNPIYFQYFFESDSLRKALAENTHGGTMDILNLGIVRKIKIPLPPLELQNQFAAFVQATDQTKSTIQASLDELETLKKSLMQEYFG